MSRSPSRDTYHHGNARQALVEAALALLESVGATGLSLRQVAERAGLSRQAPYKHFADKEALLADLVRSGFERLSAEVSAIDVDDGALEGAADRYIGFAQASPALFRLMFSSELVDLSRFPEAAAAGAASYQGLSAIVARLARPEDVADLSLAAWCLVHGYATLCIETALEAHSLRARRARLFAGIIRAQAASHST